MDQFQLEEPQRVICCCGARSWTRFIGWSQLVSIVITLFGTLGSLFTDMAIPGYDISVGSDDLLIRMKYTVLSVVIALCVLGITMTVFLLKGTYNRNPRYLQVWMTYSIIMLVLLVIATLGIIIVFAMTTYWPYIIKIVEGFLGIIVQSFFLWVVGVHKKEISGSRDALAYSAVQLKY